MSQTLIQDETPPGLANTVAHTTQTPVIVSTTINTTNTSRLTSLPRIEMDGQTPKLTLENKDRYQPVKLLGRGGVGEVNLVQDIDILRPIAMKSLLHKGSTSPETLYRFAQEVRTVGQLEHPNIIPIHDVGRDESGELYFTMKYVDGETLEDIIKKLKAGDPSYHQKYPFEARTEIFLGILNAISFAHSKGIIHRDIKPANIMVGPYGEVIVMDWGIAKQISPNALPELRTDVALPDDASGAELFKTQQGALVGTPAYMSPEQATGKITQLDARSDVYSLSVLFYELLTLRHYLHDKKNVRTMLMGVLSEAPAFAALLSIEHQSAVPPELAHFVQRGMQKDPAARFQSVDEMIDRLLKNRAGDIQVQCPSTFAKRNTFRLIHLVDRHPYATLVIVPLLGFMALVGVLALLLQLFI